MDMLAASWSMVSEMTIVNCFAKAGLSSEDQHQAASDEDNPFKDLVEELTKLQIRDQQFASANTSAEEFIDCDDQVLARAALPTEDEIIAELIGDLVEVEDSQECNDNPLTKSTMGETRDAVEVISKYSPTLDVRSVYLDISKTFDRAWHEGLLYTLHHCGISGKLFSLMKSFLAHRMQGTVLNGKASRWGTITALVPQGSILGSLFFLIYIYDLTDGLKCNVKLFADDTSIFIVVHEPTTAAENLNHDLDLINLWTTKWRMPFNPYPSKQAIEVIFSRKRCPRNHPPIFFKNAPV